MYYLVQGTRCRVLGARFIHPLPPHKGSKAFARYRTIDDDMKKELISMLE